MNAPLKLSTRDVLPTAEAAVRLDAVSKVFAARGSTPAVTALAETSLEIPAGSIYGLIGRSGAGKSTLIRLINGLEKPSSGRVLVEGTDIAPLPEEKLRELRRSIGMIFQHFNLLSSRTVYGNLSLPLEIIGLGKAEIEARVAPLLDLVGLTDKRDRYPAELSGGQKQRVGIARALTTRPRILLCDEATSALDPETTIAILNLIERVNRELGVTIILITHEIPVIKAICQRVAVMDGGHVIEEGRVFDVLTKPRHPTTASMVRGVTGVAVPPEIEAVLTEAPQPGGQAVLRIGFSGAHATAPIISRLTRVIGVDVNILAGRIDSIGSEPFGAMLVAVPAAEPELGAVIAALANSDLAAEVIGYVP